MGSWLCYFMMFIRLLLLFSVFHLLVVTSSSSSMQPRYHDDESSTLLQFRKSFSIIDRYWCDSYPKTDSWKLEGGSGDCCSWEGVECDDTVHVIGLNLSSSCLVGSISSNSTLFRLVHLQRLDLSHNYFYDSQIPPTIGRLSELTYLNLSNSGFSGQIPSELGQLSRLKYLNLSNSDFSGLIPSEISQLFSLSFLDLSFTLLELEKHTMTSLVQNLTNLEKLHLSWVHISSTVPDTLANLSSLTSLFLVRCRLHGEFPKGIFQLPNLQFLDVGENNNLTGYLPEFPRNSPLKSLRLTNTEFSGEIPSSIGNLASLNELYISYCNFSGSIPLSLGNLAQLTNLDLSRNNLMSQNSASLSWLGNLTKLTTLVLSEIELNNEIPSSLSNLNRLVHLDLRSTQLSGQIPSGLANLTQLVSLYLSFNNLHGPIPGSIFELKNLQYLHLHSNSLNGTIDLALLPKLISLQLSSNKLSLLFKNDSNITLPSLKYLGLASCNLSEFPYFLHNQYELEALDVSSNNIHGKIPQWLWNQTSLTSVNFSHNFLSGFEQHPIILPWNSIDLRSNMLQGSLPIPPISVAFYLVSKNNLTGEIPPEFCNLTTLLVLDLSFNNLSGMFPECLGNFTNYLSLLNLQSNNFHGKIPQTWKAGSILRMIDLSQNQFQGQVPKSLANCKMLEFLHIGNNQINDTFPYWLGTLPNLRILILRFNGFHGVIGKPGSTFQFPKLRIIDLSHNHFNGMLPSEYIQHWKAMKVVEGPLTYLSESITSNGLLSDSSYDYSMMLINKGVELEYRKILDVLSAIDLSSNQFEGEIPKSIGNLKELHVLNISNNFLTNHIPPSLGNITALESLDLSHNKLSGGIPQELTQLNSLAFFNVSNNHLTGPILQGKQFNTFLSNSYEGNSGLCGDLLLKKCEISKAPPTPAPFSISGEDENFDWKIVLMGYASGFVIGLAIGHFVTKWKHEWFLRTFGKRQQKWERKIRRGRRT